MKSFKDAEHLFRLAAVFVAGLVLFLLARGFLVPRSFGQYGHYRGTAIAEIAAHPIAFAGHQTCEACHSDVLEVKERLHMRGPLRSVPWGAGKACGRPCSVSRQNWKQPCFAPVATKRTSPNRRSFRRSSRRSIQAEPPAICATSHIVRRSIRKKQMNITRRRLLSFARRCYRVEAHSGGNAGRITQLQVTEHWWGMLVDVTKCIGCGNCVRACQTENQVPDGYYRTWVERYHVEGWGPKSQRWIRPTAARMAFRPAIEKGERISLSPSCAITVRTRPALRSVRWARLLSVQMAWSWSIRNTASAAAIACRRAPMAAASFIPKANRRKVHALLSPDHQRTDHRVL